MGNLFLPSIFILFTIITRLTAGDNELLQVQVIFRHGARSPVGRFTTDEARAFFFRGIGHLTDEGIQQAAFLGKLLRDRYVNTSFVDPRMLPEQLLFRSSGSERCLMTIETVANNMFPEKIPPIHTMPKEDDYLLVPKYVCPSVMQDLKKEFNVSDQEFDKIKSNIWMFSGKAMQRIALETKYLNNTNAGEVPALILEKDAGLAVPSWFNDKAYDEAHLVLFHALAVTTGIGPYHHPSWIRPKTGFLLHTLFDNIQQKVECLKNPTKNCTLDKKLFAYSTHDIVILGLLDSLGAMDLALGKDMSPEFVSTIILELWLIDGIPQVKVLFRRNPLESTLINLSGDIRNCPRGAEFCPPQNLTSCCDEYKTATPKEECWGSSPELINEWTITSLSWTLIGFIFFCISVILFLAFRLYQQRRKNKYESTYVQDQLKDTKF